MGSGEVNISASIGATCTKHFLEVPESHRNIFRPLGAVDTPVGRALAPQKPGQVEQIYGGMRRSISQLLLGHHAPNVLWRFLRHIETFLDYVGGVDTPTGRVPVTKAGPNWANTFGVGRSISQLLLGPHAPIFLEVPETHRNISDHLGDVDTPMGRALAPRKPGHVEQIHGGGGGQYLSFY